MHGGISSGAHAPADLGTADPAAAPSRAGGELLVRVRRGLVVLLAVSLVAGTLIGGTEPLEIVALLLAGGLGGVVLLHGRVERRDAAARAERDAGRERILQGLSRSLSPDAIVEAVVAELAATTRADHVVLAHLRRPDEVVEVTLSSARPGVAPSRTWLRPEVPGVAEPAAPVPADPATALRDAAEEIARRVRSAYGLRRTLAEPLLAGRRFEGALLLSRRTDEPWTPEEERLLRWAAVEVGDAYARAAQLAAAERGATTDPLTGLPNRRALDALLAGLPARRRAEDGLAIVMVDLDRFKDLNDRHGHPAGDGVLRAVAGVLARGLRTGDLAARYGGEEFAIVLRGASVPRAVEVAQRIRSAVAELPPAALGVPEGVTISAGVAIAAPDEPAGELLRRADQALYAAKRGGRDRVEIG